MSTATFDALLVVCLGSTEVEWREPFDRRFEQLRASLPHQRCELAFCVAMAPGLAETIDALAIDLCDRIGVVTLDLDTDGERLLTMALRAGERRWPEIGFERVAIDSVTSATSVNSATSVTPGPAARSSAATATDPMAIPAANP